MLFIILESRLMMFNLTNFTIPERESEVLSWITTVLGVVTILENAFLLALITKVLIRNYGKKEPFNFLMQLFFVCLNDTLCGFSLIVYGAIRVNSIMTAKVCGFSALTVITLQMVSQGNIACICIQRFICAKRIRTLGSSAKLHMSKHLVLVNVITSSVSLTYSVLKAEVFYDGQEPNMVCTMIKVVKNGEGLLHANFGAFITLTIISDVFCTMTILKLRREMSSVVQIESTQSNSELTSVQHDGSNGFTIKSRQQKAIITLFLILVLFNLSVLPSIFGQSFYLLLGIEMSIEVKKVFLLCFYLNSMFNPFIIASRTSDLRKPIEKCLRILKETLL